MTRRFWVSLALTVPVLVLAMGEMVAPALLTALGPTAWLWIQLVLSAPVVLWGGWPFFVRGAQSLVTRHLNMFTLIAIGTGAAFGYSVFAVLLLAMMALPIKMVLRWLFNLKYIVAMPEIFFNI
jgi:Cu+-exporting ATPase